MSLAYISPPCVCVSVGHYLERERNFMYQGRVSSLPPVGSSNSLRKTALPFPLATDEKEGSSESIRISSSLSMAEEWKTRPSAHDASHDNCHDATRLARRNARRTLFLIPRTDHRQKLKKQIKYLHLHFFQRPVSLVKDSTDQFAG